MQIYNVIFFCTICIQHGESPLVLKKLTCIFCELKVPRRHNPALVTGGVTTETKMEAKLKFNEIHLLQLQYAMQYGFSQIMNSPLSS